MPMCPRCGKILATKQTLNYHLNKKIRCDYIAQCKTCLVNFRSIEALEEHKSSSMCQSGIIPAVQLIQMKTADSQLIVLNIEHVIIKGSPENPIGTNYIDTIFPRFAPHANVFLKCTTERELVQKRSGKYQFVSTQVVGDFTYVLEKPAVICGKIVGNFTPPANLMDIQTPVIGAPFQKRLRRGSSFP